MEAFRQSAYKRAVEQFRQAIAERPSMSQAHYYLGLAPYNQENYGEALDAYQELII
jgi:cytochrome c-type biogenesis protein CcmH/NrfG